MSAMRSGKTATNKDMTMSPRIVGSSYAVVAALVIAFAARPGWAAELTNAEAKEFFNDRGCNACHGVDEMRIGPSYMQVAARYANASPAVVERLSRKILAGGAGSWGNVPMISNPEMSEQEASKVTRWILGLRKSGVTSQ